MQVNSPTIDSIVGIGCSASSWHTRNSTRITALAVVDRWKRDLRSACFGKIGGTSLRQAHTDNPIRLSVTSDLNTCAYPIPGLLDSVVLLLLLKIQHQQVSAFEQQVIRTLSMRDAQCSLKQIKTIRESFRKYELQPGISTLRSQSVDTARYLL